MEIIQVIGSLGQDPKLETSKAGSQYANFSMAANRKDRMGTKVTTWYACVVFGKQAEILMQYVKKGSKLFVTGELQAAANTGKDGKTYLNLDIAVSKFEMLDVRAAPVTPTPAPAPGFSGDEDVMF